MLLLMLLSLLVLWVTQKNGHSGEICGLEISDTLNSYLGAAEGKAPGYAKKKTLAAQARGLIIMYFI